MQTTEKGRMRDGARLGLLFQQNFSAIPIMLSKEMKMIFSHAQHCLGARRVEVFQPRHSPLQEHRTLQSSFNFLSRRHEKQAFPFFPFLSAAPGKSCRRPRFSHFLVSLSVRSHFVVSVNEMKTNMLANLCF